MKSKPIFYGSREFRLICCEKAPTTPIVDTPDRTYEHLRDVLAKSPWYAPDRENMVVVLLSTRRRVIGVECVSLGSLDQTISLPRDVFRSAIMANAHAIVLCHNHPSGDPTPSESDIRCTRDMIRAGQHLKIEVLDHIILGCPDFAAANGRVKAFTSLRELGHFYS